MKKILVILAVLFIAPLSVNAYEINTSFDDTKCELTVSGTQSGHDASVSLFLSSDSTLKGMKTSSITSGSFEVKFILKYEEETTLDIVVVNEAGQNRTAKLNEVIPTCSINNQQEDPNNNNQQEDPNNNNQQEEPNNQEGPNNGESFLVHFITYGGTVIPDVEVPSENIVLQPEDPEKEGYTFGGWYENQELTRSFDFGKGIIEETDIFARWIDNNKLKEYTLTDSLGNSISFTEEEGLNFDLTLIDILTLSPEQFEAAFNQPANMFETFKQLIGDTLVDEGTMLAVYGIELNKLAEDPADNQEMHKGPFTFKIKLTDEMKKYNSFKIIYIDMDENGNFVKEEVVSLKVEGDYLVGTLPHLSAYALTGSTTESPKTNDNIMKFINILAISLIGLSISGVSALKLKTNKAKIK